MTASFDKEIAEMAGKATELQLCAVALAAGAQWIEQSGSVPEGVEAGEVELRFRRISICLVHANLRVPSFETACDILYRGQEIGTYRLITDLDGQAQDDYWVIDPAAAERLKAPES